jgi:predicted outer membrane protein
MPPPPELSQQQKAQIGQLHAAAPGAIDRLYLTQQVPSHQQALAINGGYAQGGDVPALRQTAGGAVPVITSHLQQAQQLLGTVR